MMLSSSRIAAFKPATVSQRKCITTGPRPCSVQLLSKKTRRVQVQAQEENSTQTQEPASSQQQQPGQVQEELPIWVRREKERELQASAKGELPWPLYLLFSTFVAIASVGSVFEYFDKNPIFGVIPPESPLWAPILGLFAFTGLPTAGFLFFKGVNAANEAAERQDKMDGYIK